jgi:hypothetical protein
MNFDIASGTVIGRYHLHKNMNNQDALVVLKSEDKIVAVVCDGCGSGEKSEVGANLGASIIAKELFELEDAPFTMDDLDRRLGDVRVRVVKMLSDICNNMSEGLYLGINEYFLFTCVIVVMNSSYTYIASIGDGIIALNGDVKNLGPFEGNAPPYIGYGAIKKYLTDEVGPEYYTFQIHEVVNTESVQSILIGTDGVEDLINAENESLPGKKELVGPISQFWTNESYFRNEAALERRLNMINKTDTRLSKERTALTIKHGYLQDDTTMIVIRRNEGK